MTWCLIPKFVDQFKKEIIDGTINPDKLNEMTSKERHKFFTDKFGDENAKQINSLFESKLLLKNKQQGMITWANKLLVPKEIKRDIITRIQRMDKILNPAEEKMFLEELVSKKLGTDISFEEAQKITEMSANILELESKTNKTKSDIPLGRAKLDLTDYVNSLSGKKAPLLTNVAGIPRSLMASLDLSAPLNQGWGMLSRKQFYTSLGKMFKYAISKNDFRDLQAEIITDPQYSLAKKSGLRLTELGDKLELREEQFMSSLLDKVPGIAASQRAYTGFLNKLRFDVFKDLIKKAEVSGEDISIGSKSTEDIAKVVNNFTGGARVGKLEQATPALNAIFFSPRKITSTLQMINPLNYLDPKISKTAKLAATRNLIGSLSMSAGVIALYGLLSGNKQETNPTSSDFGKIKSGDTRLDISGGNATYANILSRLITQRMKSSTGITRPLGTDYGQTSGADLIAQFLRYKTSPNASLFIDIVSGANAIGEKKTIPQSIIDRFKPMFANSVVELLQSDTDGKFGFALTGLLGAGLNTYKTETDWGESTTKEMTQFKEKVGQVDFEKANKEFNNNYYDKLKILLKNPEYLAMSDEDKQGIIAALKNKIKKDIFNKYDFEIKKEYKSTIQQIADDKKKKKIERLITN